MEPAKVVIKALVLGYSELSGLGKKPEAGAQELDSRRPVIAPHMLRRR